MVNTVEQQTLFDFAGVAGPVNYVPLIEWSYSRRNLFEKCLLWYYYKYYGASARTAKSESLKQQLRFLTTLGNTNLRAGKILHLVILTYFKRLREGNPLSPDDALRWAQRLFRDDLNYSIAWQRGIKASNNGNRMILLSEFYYGLPDAQALWNKAALRLQTALATFLNGPSIKRFRSGALHPRALIEKRKRVNDEHLRMAGQIDLAYPENGRVSVVDWKIGATGGQDDSLQLLSYALLALEEYKCSADSIGLFKVNLEDGSVSAYSVNSEEVRRARMRIIQDTMRMESLDGYGRQAVVAAFTPCQQSLICRSCPFQSLCPKGEEVNA